MRLAVESTKTSDAFAAALKEAGAPAPWTEHEKDPATLLDANGVAVLQIDPEVERTDAEANMIAAWVLVAVNTCAGFKAVREEA